MGCSLFSNGFCQSSPRWLRWCSITALGAAIGFLFLSLFAHNYRFTSGRDLVPSLLFVLIFATFLNAYSIWHFRNEHRVADLAFRNTDCETSSIFLNVLDWILMADR